MKGNKRHGAYCKLSIGHRVRVVITTTVSFPSSSSLGPLSSLYIGLGSGEGDSNHLSSVVQDPYPLS